MATDKAKRVQMIAVLAEGFRQAITEATLMAYEMGLHDVPTGKLEAAVRQAISTCKFMPTVKELRDLATGMRDQDRGVLAWEAVMRVPFNPYTWMDFDDHVTNATIRNLGGWPTFCERFSDAESEKWARKEFLDTYERLFVTGVNGDACRPLTGLSQKQCTNGVQHDPLPYRVATGLPALPASKIRQPVGIGGTTGLLKLKGTT